MYIKMKCLFVLCFTGLALSLADSENFRGCIDILGRCVYECPQGTHAYTVNCDEPLPEATCDQPNPVKEEGAFCDYPDCYCDHPTVRNTQTKECVSLDKCPGKKVE